MRTGVRHMRVVSLAGIAALLAALAPASIAWGEVEWRPPEAISAADQDATGPKVAASASGEAAAVWTRLDGATGRVQASLRSSAVAGFSVAQTLSGAGEEAWQPQVAIDPAGNAVVVWTRFDGANSRIAASFRPAGGSFSAAQTISVQNKDADSPQVSIDPQGNVVAVWIRYDGANTRIQAATRQAGGSFAGEETISYTGQYAYEPDIAPEQNREATAIWSRFDGANFRTEAAAHINRTAPYETPQSASPAHFALVPVFRQCATGGNPANASHAGPLAGASCSPAATTVGAVAHMGGQASAYARFTTVPGDLGTPADDADASIAASVTDVRTGSVAGADYNPVPSGPDVTLSARFRITDLRNTTGAISCGSAGTCPGTTIDFDFDVPVDCAATADMGIGAACATSTTFDALNPGAVAEGRASVLQEFRARLSDAGANGVRGDADDKLFAQQGFYVP